MASNAVPPTYARMKITTDAAARVWREGCAAIARRYPRYQTLIEGGPSGLPNFYHILGAALKCDYAEVTNDNVAAVLADIEQRAEQAGEPRAMKQAALI